MDSHRNEVILHQDDPLFGVLSEDQVGICKMTGRRKIAPEVLEEMRRYLLMATEEDKKIRIDRVRSSVAEAEKDPFLQKTMLRLETAPTFTNQIDKGKGVVYDFDLNTSAEPRLEAKDSADKLMASAIKANIAGSLVHRWEDLRVSDRNADLGSIVHQAFLPHEPSSSRVSERGHDSTASLHGNSTEYGPGYFVSKPSGVVHKSSKSRRRPYIKKRREQQGQSSGILHQLYGENEGTEKLGSKRKAGDAILKEKTGGVWRQDESFAPFNQMINACKLEELQSHGNGFTWSGLRSNSWVHTRLDRCFGNRAWFKKFPCSNQTFLDKRGSDHRPVLIHLIESQEKYRGDRIHQAEAALEHEQSALQQSTARIRLLKEDLVKAQRDEETYWWQKSRDKWLSRGDRNSHFFHISVNAARARNNIDKLVNAEGEEVFSEAAKGEVAVDFFRNLFRSTNPAPFTDWFNDMQPRASSEETKLFRREPASLFTDQRSNKKMEPQSFARALRSCRY
ncbi:hypothetical protein YC2023_074357 [Brassica napus]